ncbi:MAG: DUF930 domain-containing protein [Hansschlegelia sp.]
MRRVLGLTLACLCAEGSQAAAADRSLQASLMRLEPETRFHQLCDIEMMRRIAAENGSLKPDRVVMDAEHPALLSGDEIKGAGAAVRSRGQWFRMTFRCRATPDRLTVLDLQYRIGSAIPESRWDAIGLWK